MSAFKSTAEHDQVVSEARKTLNASFNFPYNPRVDYNALAVELITGERTPAVKGYIL